MSLIPDKKVRDRYGVSSSCLYLWEKNPALGFPKAYYINKRKFRDEAELDAFDEAQKAASAAAARPPGKSPAKQLAPTAA